MAAGEEPDCLIDAWIKAMIEARNDNETGANGEKALLNREYSDHEIAMVLLSFLFASQGESAAYAGFGFLRICSVLFCSVLM